MTVIQKHAGDGAGEAEDRRTDGDMPLTVPVTPRVVWSQMVIPPHATDTGAIMLNGKTLINLALPANSVSAGDNSVVFAPDLSIDGGATWIPQGQTFGPSLDTNVLIGMFIYGFDAIRFRFLDGQSNPKSVVNAWTLSLSLQT